MKILYGTGNIEKLKQLKKIIDINKYDVTIITAKEVGFDKDIVEDGTTFEENSKIKAMAIREYCIEKGIKDVIILTDDAGLCVDKLNGEPGIYSARYAGDHAPQDITIKKLIDNMKEYAHEDRTGKFVCVLTASLPNGEYISSRGEVNGYIAEKVGKLGGLTYEPVFIPIGFDKPMSEMSTEEFAKVKNHRDMAMMQMLPKLKELGY